MTTVKPLNSTPGLAGFTQPSMPPAKVQVRKLYVLRGESAVSRLLNWPQTIQEQCTGLSATRPTTGEACLCMTAELIQDLQVGTKHTCVTGGLDLSRILHNHHHATSSKQLLHHSRAHRQECCLHWGAPDEVSVPAGPARRQVAARVVHDDGRQTPVPEVELVVRVVHRRGVARVAGIRGDGLQTHEYLAQEPGMDQGL